MNYCLYLPPGGVRGARKTPSPTSRCRKWKMVLSGLMLSWETWYVVTSSSPSPPSPEGSVRFRVDLLPDLEKSFHNKTKYFRLRLYEEVR